MPIEDLFENPLVAKHLPVGVRHQLERFGEHLSLLTEMRNPRVLRRIGPSAVRGLILKQGVRDEPARIVSAHETIIDWQLRSDSPELQALYQKAKRLQWNGATDLDWSINVEPESNENALLPDDFLAWDHFESLGLHMTLKDRRHRLHQVLGWMLSQFLHGEQGALMAAAQVTECVPFTDGKFYGATQVVDEARHVEVFHRYLETKLGATFPINDNLFTIIDSLLRDSRWDMKFLGMQIMVEGLALGAFSMLHKLTKEPLLRELLRRVIHDEARHVSYGVHALKHVYTREFSENERREREDWAFEVALLMRNRFRVHELYESDFQQMMTRRQWNEMVDRSPGMRAFRTTMFSRLVPNLREIGLLTDRILPHYKRVGLAQYMNGRSATQIEAEDLVR